MRWNPILIRDTQRKVELYGAKEAWKLSIFIILSSMEIHGTKCGIKKQNKTKQKMRAVVFIQSYTNATNSQDFLYFYNNNGILLNKHEIFFRRIRLYFVKEGLHDTVRSHTRMMFPWFPFVSRGTEKNNTTRYYFRFASF